MFKILKNIFLFLSINFYAFSMTQEQYENHRFHHSAAVNEFLTASNNARKLNTILDFIDFFLKKEELNIKQKNIQENNSKLKDEYIEEYFNIKNSFYKEFFRDTRKFAYNVTIMHPLYAIIQILQNNRERDIDNEFFEERINILVQEIIIGTKERFTSNLNYDFCDNLEQTENKLAKYLIDNNTLFSFDYKKVVRKNNIGLNILEISSESYINIPFLKKFHNLKNINYHDSYILKLLRFFLKDFNEKQDEEDRKKQELQELIKNKKQEEIDEAERNAQELMKEKSNKKKNKNKKQPKPKPKAKSKAEPNKEQEQKAKLKAEEEKQARIAAEQKVIEERKKEREVRRKAQEARIAEKKAKQEEANKKAAEEAKIAEEKRLVEEKAEQEKLVEEARLVEEKRLQEETRIAEGKKLAQQKNKFEEEQRLAEEKRITDGRVIKQARTKKPLIEEQSTNIPTLVCNAHGEDKMVVADDLIKSKCGASELAGKIMGNIEIIKLHYNLSPITKQRDMGQKYISHLEELRVKVEILREAIVRLETQPLINDNYNQLVEISKYTEFLINQWAGHIYQIENFNPIYLPLREPVEGGFYGKDGTWYPNPSNH